MRRVLKAVDSEQILGDLTTLKEAASVEEIKRAHKKLKKYQILIMMIRVIGG